MDGQDMMYHTIEYYLTIKGNEVPIHATIWISLQNIMLGDLIQS
jgi:hypothetical protein